MNIVEADILKIIKKYGYTDQRSLSSSSGHSLGTVNCAVKKLVSDGYLDCDMMLTDKASMLLERSAPKNAVILAAGYGTRMIPINYSIPKALLEVNNEPLIERQIKQLNKAGIFDISIVVGYLKEAMEYLIDKYGVRLIVNTEYYSKNNLHSLRLAENIISDTYIVPCDIWCENDPFDKYELYSWYTVSDRKDASSSVRINRKHELIKAGSENADAMVGIAYITKEDSVILRQQLAALDDCPDNNDLFWESALMQDNKMIIPGKLVSSKEFIEINTYEQLQELDSCSATLHSKTLDSLAKIMHAKPKDITGIQLLKKGMTNRSFVFCCFGKKYIMRIPGEGTSKLINRAQEADVYKTISGKGLCDDVVFIDPQTGYKITEYIEGARTCDPNDKHDLIRCMKKLRSFHDLKLTVSHTFDIFGQIRFYQELWGGAPSVFKDHTETTHCVFSLRSYIESHAEPFVLTHIDAVADNFIFSTQSDGTEQLQLTDWEYAGMQDPHIDIAMFCIYSLFNLKQTDELIDIYFEGRCPEETRIKIYCYISVCGLLWSNWCEYKRHLGVEFGEYSLKQYRYAKDYYRLAKELMDNE